MNHASFVKKGSENAALFIYKWYYIYLRFSRWNNIFKEILFKCLRWKTLKYFLSLEAAMSKKWYNNFLEKRCLIFWMRQGHKVQQPVDSPIETNHWLQNMKASIATKKIEKGIKDWLEHCHISLLLDKIKHVVGVTSDLCVPLGCHVLDSEIF